MKDLLKLVLDEIKNTPKDILIKKTYEIDNELKNITYVDNFFEVIVPSLEISTTDDNFCYQLSKNNNYLDRKSNIKDNTYLLAA
ncbi:hypothetical protein [Cetobacterium sp.]|uniref:hypothetical protein n=1 Tax=Cetobacterium sp. TaxID=2071632 RepID=UPI003F303196